MRSALRQLEAKLSEVETTIDLLVARKRNALLQQRVYDALNKTGGQKDKERANRARDAVMEAEARARAMAELHQRGIDVQLDDLSQEQVVEHQLNSLKAKKRSTSEPPLLHEGNPHPSPLLHPQPQQSEPSRKRAVSKPEQNEPTPPPVSSPAPKELDLAQLKRLLEE
jgi:hypothetical protein